MQISVNQVIEFLTELFHSKLGYSALNTARSAVVMYVSLTTGVSIDGEHILLKKFMKGVFALRPALPKYVNTWDVSLVLGYLKGQFPLDALPLLGLSRKLVTLLLLLTGQRGQSIHLLKVRDTTCTDQKLILRFSSLLKTSKPGKHLGEIVLPAFDSVPGLCVVRTFRAYITRTKRHRGSGARLLLQTIRPFRPIARDTLGKWVKAVLMAAGVDMQIFGVHSTRSASTSAACGKGVPLMTILRTAGWERECTFRQFYDMPVTRNTKFADSVLGTVGE